MSRLFHPRLWGRNKAASSTLPSDATCYWPEDLLATDFPNTRIATYGYDSRVTHLFNGPSSQSNILNHGESLLHTLEANRRDDPQRPIIFIVHSLAGLILKDVLRRSWRTQTDDEDLRNVYEATIAVIFMGTPHRGSHYASWGVMAWNIAVASGFDANDSILRDLKVESTILDILRTEFGEMLKEKTFEIQTFQESKGLKGVRGLTGKVSIHRLKVCATVRKVSLLFRSWKMFPQGWMMGENAKTT